MEAVERVRAWTLPRAAFARLALVTLAFLFLIILSGSAVRLTGSGLGCANWPRCGETSFLPPSDFHALVEFGNRLVSIPVGVLTLATAVGAWFVKGLPRWVALAAAALLLLVLVEAWLGGVTVTSELDPVVVMVHFLLALLAVALAVTVVVGARGASAAEVPRSLTWLAAALVPVAGAVVVSGAFVTAAGPHSGGADVLRFGDLLETVEVHVGMTGGFGLAVFAFFVALSRYRRDAGSEFALAAIVLVLLLVQMGVGEIQWRNRLPWGVVLVHVMLATAVWAGVVALAARLYLSPARP
jgi:cytochrome c oxidase assembly protein subunit 15